MSISFCRRRPRVFGRRLVLERLEERIVLDAAVDAAAQDNPDNPDNENVNQKTDSGGDVATPRDPMPDTSPTSESLGKVFTENLNVVLISNALDQIEALSDAVGEDAEVIVYDSSTDDLGTINGLLQDLMDTTGCEIGHLGILTHGDPGILYLTDGEAVSHFNVWLNPDPWTDLGSFLSDDARIDLYGCDIGAGDDGLLLVTAIADATGATVWASDDATGSGASADWDLEVRTGSSDLDYLVDASLLEEQQISLPVADVICNPSFESGMTGWWGWGGAWEVGGPGNHLLVTPSDGDCLAQYYGDYDDDDSITATVTLPADADSLTFDVYWNYFDSIPPDGPDYVQLRINGNSEWTSTGSGSGGWQTVTVDLEDYRDQMVTLEFFVYNFGWAFNTGGEDMIAIDNLLVTCEGVTNTAPSAEDFSLRGTEDTNVSVDLGDHIFDAEDADSDLQVMFTSLRSSRGELKVGNDIISDYQWYDFYALSGLLFDPAVNWSGTTTVDYKVKDTGDLVSSPDATITFNFEEVNDSPIFVDDVIRNPSFESGMTGWWGWGGAWEVGGLGNHLLVTPSDGDCLAQYYGDYDDDDSITTTVTLPADADSLTFYVYRVFFDSEDYVQLKIDGNPEWTSVGGWSYGWDAVTVDLEDYRDQMVTLEFFVNNEGSMFFPGGEDMVAIDNLVVTCERVANTAPSAEDFLLRGTEDTNVSVDLGDHISDAEDADSDLQVMFTSLPSSSVGELKVGNDTISDGRWYDFDALSGLVFDPARNWNGTTTIDYIVRDTGNLGSSPPATITLDFEAVNDEPIVDGVIYNPSFESGMTGWGWAGAWEVGEPGNRLVSPSDGDRFAQYYGGYDNDDSITTTVTLPADADSLTFDVYWNYFDSIAPDGPDYVQLRINGNPEWTSTGSGSGGWQTVTVDLEDYRDQMVTIEFFVYNFGWVFNTGGEDMVAIDNLVVTCEGMTNTAPLLSLDNSTVAENQAVGTAIGAFSSSDQDLGDCHTYTLVSGAGDTDNGSFTIDGSSLKTASVFDRETQDSYSIRVQTDDGNGGIYEEVFTVTVTDDNDAPTDISLDNTTIAENQPSGTIVGHLSTADQDSADTHSYTLVSGLGDTDNAWFTIDSSSLKTAAVFDYESKNVYSIRVQTDDGNGGTHQEVLTIIVTDEEDTVTAPCVTLVKDIVMGDLSPSVDDLTEVNGVLFFTADDGVHGRELWKSDGTEDGTAMVKDIRVGTQTSALEFLTNVNGTLFFRAHDGVHGSELWRSDGTEYGTVMVKDIFGGAISTYPDQLTAVNDTLFFMANDGMNGGELWKSERSGLPDDPLTTDVDESLNTVMVKDIQPGGTSRPWHLAEVDGVLFFQAYSVGYGVELWKSDGTEVGTVMVKDINPGLWDGNPNKLTDVDGTLFFRANDGAHGIELWKSESSGLPDDPLTTDVDESLNTVLVKDVHPAGDSNPNRLTAVNDTLFFEAEDGEHGPELWTGKTSGLPDDPLTTDIDESLNTVMVNDIKFGSEGCSLRRLTDVDGTLFFRADDGFCGQELWKCEGSGLPDNPLTTDIDESLNTVMVNDICEGIGGSVPAYLTAVGTSVYFQANDYEDDGTHTGIRHGIELWTSDGTADGTCLVADIYPGGHPSAPRYLTNVSGTLFFEADNGVCGRELWRLGPPPPPPNRPPVALNFDFSGDEDVPTVVDGWDFFDPDGDAAMTIRLTSTPTHGTLFLDSNSNDQIEVGEALGQSDTVDWVDATISQMVKYIGDANYFGLDSFNYVVSDTRGAEGTPTDEEGTASVTLNAVNDAPVASPFAETGDEDVSLNLAGWGMTDPEDSAGPGGPDNPSEIIIQTLPSNGLLLLNDTPLSSGDTVAWTDRSAMTFLGNPNWFGSTSFTYVMRDDGGTAGGGADTSAPVSVDITVSSVSDAPLAVPFAATGNEDEIVALDGWGMTDPEDAAGPGGADDPVEIIIESVPSNGLLLLESTPLLAGDAVAWGDRFGITFQGDSNWYGTTSFTYTVRDDGGTANGGEDTSGAATIHISVLSLNDAPVAVSFEETGEENVPVPLTGWGMTDPEDAAGPGGPDDPLEITIESIPPNGLLTLNDAGLSPGDYVAWGDAQDVKFMPDLGWFGVTSFAYSVTDDGDSPQGGPVTSDPSLVTISVIPTSGGPYIDTSEIPASGELYEGCPGAFTLKGRHVHQLDPSEVYFSVQGNAIPNSGPFDAICLATGVLEPLGPVVHNTDGSYSQPFSFQPYDDGDFEIQFFFQDALGHAADERFTVAVLNVPPIEWPLILDFAVNEGETIGPLDLNDYFVDVPADLPLEFTYSVDGGEFMPVPDPSNFSLTCPDNGVHAITVRADDGDGPIGDDRSSIATVTLSITDYEDNGGMVNAGFEDGLTGWSQFELDPDGMAEVIEGDVGEPFLPATPFGITGDRILRLSDVEVSQTFISDGNDLVFAYQPICDYFCGGGVFGYDVYVREVGDPHYERIALFESLDFYEYSQGEHAKWRLVQVDMTGQAGKEVWIRLYHVGRPGRVYLDFSTDNVPPPVAHSQGVTAFEDVPLAITLSGDDCDPWHDRALTYYLESQPAQGKLYGSLEDALARSNTLWLDRPLDSNTVWYVSEPDDSTDTSFSFYVRCDGGSRPSREDAVVTVEVTPTNDEPTAHSQQVTAYIDIPLAIALGGDDGDPELEQALTYYLATRPDQGDLYGSQEDAVNRINPLPVNESLTSNVVWYMTGLDETDEVSFAFYVKDYGGTANGGNDTSGPAMVTTYVTAYQDNGGMVNAGFEDGLTGWSQFELDPDGMAEVIEGDVGEPLMPATPFGTMGDHILRLNGVEVGQTFISDGNDLVFAYQPFTRGLGVSQYGYEVRVREVGDPHYEEIVIFSDVQPNNIFLNDAEWTLVQLDMTGQAGKEVWFLFYHVYGAGRVYLDFSTDTVPPPVAHSQVVTALEDVPLAITLSGEDGDPWHDRALTYYLESPPARGKLYGSIEDALARSNQLGIDRPLDSNTVWYISEPDDPTDTSFSFYVHCHGGCRPSIEDAVVTVEVTPTNDEPTAHSQQVTAYIDIPLAIALGGDDGDPELEQALTYYLATRPDQGYLYGSQEDAVNRINPLPVNGPLTSNVVWYMTGLDETDEVSFTFYVKDDGGTADGGNDTSGPAMVTTYVTAYQDNGGMVNAGFEEGFTGWSQLLRGQGGQGVAEVIEGDVGEAFLPATPFGITGDRILRLSGVEVSQTFISDGNDLVFAYQPIQDFIWGGGVFGYDVYVREVGDPHYERIADFESVDFYESSLGEHAEWRLVQVDMTGQAGKEVWILLYHEYGDGRVYLDFSTSTERVPSPVAHSQVVTAFEDVPLAITLSGDDGDARHDRALTYYLESQPAQGRLYGSLEDALARSTQLGLDRPLDSNTVWFISEPDVTTDTSFSFYVRCDGGNHPRSEEAAVTAELTPTNDQPTAHSQRVTAYIDIPLAITLAGDDGDPEQEQALTYYLATRPDQGDLYGSPEDAVNRINPLPLNVALDSNTVWFMADSDGSHEVSFSYYVQDNGGVTSGGYANFTVGAFNSVPQAIPIEDMRVPVHEATDPIDLNDWFTDVDADIPLDSFTYWDTAGHAGVLTSGEASSFSLTYGAAGDYTVTVVATDKDGGTSEPVTFNVAVESPAPGWNRTAFTDTWIGEGEFDMPFPSGAVARLFTAQGRVDIGEMEFGIREPIPPGGAVSEWGMLPFRVESSIPRPGLAGALSLKDALDGATLSELDSEDEPGIPEDVSKPRKAKTHGLLKTWWDELYRDEELWDRLSRKPELEEPELPFYVDIRTLIERLSLEDTHDGMGRADELKEKGRLLVIDMEKIRVADLFVTGPQSGKVKDNAGVSDSAQDLWGCKVVCFDPDKVRFPDYLTSAYRSC